MAVTKGICITSLKDFLSGSWIEYVKEGILLGMQFMRVFRVFSWYICWDGIWSQCVAFRLFPISLFGEIVVAFLFRFILVVLCVDVTRMRLRCFYISHVTFIPYSLLRVSSFFRLFYFYFFVFLSFTQNEVVKYHQRWMCLVDKFSRLHLAHLFVRWIHAQISHSVM